MQPSRNRRERSGLVRMGKHLMEEVELEIEGFVQQGGVGDQTLVIKQEACGLVKRLITASCYLCCNGGM